MTLTKGFARNNAKTPLDQRQADMATIVGNVDGSPRTGVLGSASFAIVTTTGTMNVAVAAAEFVTSKGKSDGVMIFTNDGSVNVLIGAAPASNSRIDVIWVKHEDNTTGDAASLPIFGVTAGVAAASPVKPAIPTGALELATLRIYAGTVATNGGANVLTNTYQMTVPRGGVVPFRTKADLDAWTTATIGQLAEVLVDGAAYLIGIYEWTGAAWLLLASDTGWIVAGLAANWASFNAGTYGAVAYKRRGDMVTLRGIAQASGGATTTIMTLPVGYRPIVQKQMVCDRAGAYGFININVDGTVVCAVAPGVGTTQSFGDLTFSVS